MKNTRAISIFIHVEHRDVDPLDTTACLRAASWLRWCDGFGATLTAEEASRLAKGGNLGEAARSLIRRLSAEYPALPEDCGLQYLEDQDSTGWMHAFPLSNSEIPAHVLSPFSKVEKGRSTPTLRLD